MYLQFVDIRHLIKLLHLSFVQRMYLPLPEILIIRLHVKSYKPVEYLY
jgi:hypothetical protein